MRYEIKALRGRDEVVMLAVEALDANEAALQVQGQGCAVLSIRASNAALPSFARRRAAFPLVLFSQELLALLNAGLSLVEALEALSEKEANADVRKTLEKLVSRLYEGQTLSSAMQDLPAIFPPLYVATVRASEKSGGIVEALGRYVAYQAQIDQVRKKIVNASIYPVLLMLVGGLVVLFLMAYVVPKFAAVYEGTNRDLPLLSRLLLDWGGLLQQHGMLFSATVAALILGAGYGLSRPYARQAMLRRLQRIPAVGQRMHIYQLARFYRTLGMLLKGGVVIVQAMEMVSGLLSPEARTSLQLALQDIREGRSISQAMEARQLTTPVALRMLRVGERAGNMGDMMERIAGFYDEDMARWVDWFTRLFEPILMALIGLVIGAIVVLMYLPVFELAGSLQ
ncbi:type II secretion system F family protein [Noviherbaspirillum massiliense]|uniref:type II secretion system F family protein n=1 Tax=Noviherbaspirillum massiliense TaxID=1465823 RepID=UPI000474ADE8|nr:type II secretion system F family protein [Noviherbaspirillum massiliense]